MLKKELTKECATAWDGDTLDRKQVAKYLTPVIGSIRQPFVIGINSPFGTGKSFFVQNWKRQLEDDGYKAVYFNAWESDYSDDALIAFISSIKQQLVDEKTNDKKDIKKNTKKVAELVRKGGVYLSKKAIPIVAKGIARKVIGSDTVEEIVDLSSQTDEEIINIFGEVAEHSLKKHDAIKLSVESFKTYLKELVLDLTQDIQDEDKKKLIIFVDELDRCKPTYAVEVLECIKHLFSAEGVVFVLAIDEQQIKAAIASVYGTQLSGEGYLRKFIDWQLNLPKPSSVKYAAYLYNSFALEETGRYTNNHLYKNSSDMFIKMFGVFSYVFGLTLREQAQCFTILNLFVRSLDKSEHPFAFLSPLVAVLQLKHRERLENYFINKEEPETLLKFIEENYKFIEIFDREIGSWEKQWRRVLYAALCIPVQIKQINEILTTTRFSNEDRGARSLERKDYLSHIVDCYHDIWQGNRGEESKVEYIYQRLEKASFLTNL